jgi:hypothetical protein
MTRSSTLVGIARGRWLRESFETIYAVILAIGLMGGIWGAVYFLFGSHGLISRFSGSLLGVGYGGTSLLTVMVALLAGLAIIQLLPRMQSSRPASALLATVIVGGYAFLFRAFSVGI